MNQAEQASGFQAMLRHAAMCAALAHVYAMKCKNRKDPLVVRRFYDAREMVLRPVKAVLGVTRKQSNYPAERNRFGQLLRQQLNAFRIEEKAKQGTTCANCGGLIQPTTPLSLPLEH